MLTGRSPSRCSATSLIGRTARLPLGSRFEPERRHVLQDLRRRILRSHRPSPRAGLRAFRIEAASRSRCSSAAVVDAGLEAVASRRTAVPRFLFRRHSMLPSRCTPMLTARGHLSYRERLPLGSRSGKRNRTPGRVPRGPRNGGLLLDEWTLALLSLALLSPTEEDARGSETAAEQKDAGRLGNRGHSDGRLAEVVPASHRPVSEDRIDRTQTCCGR